MLVQRKAVTRISKTTTEPAKEKTLSFPFLPLNCLLEGPNQKEDKDTPHPHCKISPKSSSKTLIINKCWRYHNSKSLYLKKTLCLWLIQWRVGLFHLYHLIRSLYVLLPGVEGCFSFFHSTC